MPLFKKKEDKPKEKSGYPTQSAGAAAPPPVNPQYAGAPPQYPDAPPPYSAIPQPPQGYPQPPPSGAQGYPQASPPGAQGYQQPYPGYQQPPPGAYQPPAGYPQAQLPAQPTTVVVQGGFDAGARFSGNQASIPPPPPGCMPNAAQMAQMQGHNVVVTQQKGSYMTGGSDGGYTVW